jgi:hypothetical protein
MPCFFLFRTSLRCGTPIFHPDDPLRSIREAMPPHLLPLRVFTSPAQPSVMQAAYPLRRGRKPSPAALPRVDLSRLER